MITCDKSIKKYSPSFTANRNDRFQRLWWLQDGALCHRRRAVTDRLTELFGNRVIALNRAVEWPPRSPDPTPLDFFCGVTLRARFLKHRQAILKNSSNEFDMKRTALGTIEQWYDVPLLTWSGGAGVCVQRDGGHFED